MAKKLKGGALTIKFVRDFDGHTKGETLQVSESNANYFIEWDAAECIGGVAPEPAEAEVAAEE